MNNVDTLKKYDIITFTDDEKIMVISTCKHKNRKFADVREMLADESDFTGICKVMEIHSEDAELEEINDQKLIREIFPLL